MNGQSPSRPLTRFIPGMFFILMGGVVTASGLFMLVVAPILLAKYSSIAAYSDSPYWWCGLAMGVLGGCRMIFSGPLMLRGRWRRALILLALAFGLCGLGQFIAPPKDRDRDQKNKSAAGRPTDSLYSHVHSENAAA
jgi:hypothetical protein